MRLSEVQKFSINNLWNGVYRQLRAADTLQAAAQSLADACYEEFKESLVLVRIFITIPYAKLPKFNQRFAADYAKKLNLYDNLTDQTPVLSLVGTRGLEPGWNDWKDSKEHVGIPMISRESVLAIPMITRLLNDLGLGLGWIPSTNGNGLGESRGHIGGVFHVPNAAQETDSEGRKVIPGQDFVEQYGVQTVFGNGARYSVEDSDFLVSIFFARQSLDKATAHRFNSLLYLFKTTISPLIESGRFYPEQESH